MQRIKGLVKRYRTDSDSGYLKLRYHVRVSHDQMLRRIVGKHGRDRLKSIQARKLLTWHKDWSHHGQKLAMGHAFVGQLRTLFAFGATILEDRECERLCSVLHKMRFPSPKPRTERLTTEQAIAVRAWAHKMLWSSIALAQSFQFELMLRQKDVIGEWIPDDEPGISDILRGDFKWLWGLLWSEIDDNFILRHKTSKRGKDLEVDLRLAPMVMEELCHLAKVATPSDLHRSLLPSDGPMIICEHTSLPFASGEFRRKWRIVADAAGIPRTVRNMDSRAGAISEATDAGADLEHVRHAALHSNISMTQRYSRGEFEKRSAVQRRRVEHRDRLRSARQ